MNDREKHQKLVNAILDQHNTTLQMPMISDTAIFLTHIIANLIMRIEDLERKPQNEAMLLP